MTEYNAAYDTVERNAAERDLADRGPLDDDVLVVVPAEGSADAEPAEPAEPTDVADPVEPVEPVDEPVTPAPLGSGPVATGREGDDERWHEIVAGFIDDPRGSVAEAADLIEADVTALIAALSRHRDALGETWQADESADPATATEDLRIAMRSYRDFSRQIAASLKALS